MLDYELQSSDVNLRHADFSNNLITSVRPLGAFTRLQSLKLDGNQIEQLRGFNGLGMLKTLR